MDVVPRPAEATRAHPPPAAFATRSWIALSRSRAPRSKDASLDASSVAFANPSLAPNARAPVSADAKASNASNASRAASVARDAATAVERLV